MKHIERLVVGPLAIFLMGCGTNLGETHVSVVLIDGELNLVAECPNNMIKVEDVVNAVHAKLRPEVSAVIIEDATGRYSFRHFGIGYLSVRRITLGLQCHPGRAVSLYAVLNGGRVDEVRVDYATVSDFLQAEERNWTISKIELPSTITWGDFSEVLAAFRLAERSLIWPAFRFI